MCLFNCLREMFRSVFLVVYLGSTVFDLKLNVLTNGAMILKNRKKLIFLTCSFSLDKLKN